MKRSSTRGKRVNGICEDAVRLGVTRQHLRHVIAGRRQSPGLLDRYRRLKRQREV